MAPTFLSKRNLKFVLYEMLDTASLTEHERFADHDRELYDMVLDTAERIGRDLIWPAFKEMDLEAPTMVDGAVKVHPVVSTFIEECGRGGWIGAHASYELGGQQLPNAIMTAFRGYLAGANYSAAVYPTLTSGAAHLITTFGSQELIDRYIPNMFSGKWQGTMALTEPQAGSSLADLTTEATPTDDGYYKLKGQKIFISCADFDSIENVVHLLIGRIEGAPPGVKGISLFVVPRQRFGEDGALESNDVTCATIYHKLGYRGAPITQLSFGDEDDCRAWLVGEPHKGLKYMFQMMNEARLEVGMAATAIASAAYHAALDYTRERPQGRQITERDPSQPQIPIIEHADVKRMLLFQRAIVEGSIALLLQCALYDDLSHVLDGEEAKKYELLLGLLTPVAKTYPSEMAIHAVSQGLQCLGGYGYCEDFPLEQYYRDVRIHPIHEGTTGIQALDLLGRKVVGKGGQAVFAFLGELQRTIGEAADVEQLAPLSASLAEAVERLQNVTTHLTGMAMSGKIDAFLADATPFLELFGNTCIAWQWLKQAIVAQRALEDGPSADEARFYRGKVLTARYYFDYELPKTEGLATCLLKSGGITLESAQELFGEA